jgi:protein SCO1
MLRVTFGAIMNSTRRRMTSARLTWPLWLGVLLMLSWCAALPARGADGAGPLPVPVPLPLPLPLPGNSLYQLQAQLTDQHGNRVGLDAGRGHPVLVSMFYTSCQFVCPMLIETVRATEAPLSDAERQRLTVLMVTFDPAHDSVAVLKQTAEQRQVDGKRWALARTDAHTVRKIAAVLGIQYRALGNGDFNHTTAVVLLDAQGRVVGRTSQLGAADPAFVALLKLTLQAPAH